MVSQFVSPDKVRLLTDLDFDFPEGTHAIGRLDNNSEGLLLLTTNKKITKLLFQSATPHKRTYLVAVQRIVTTETVALLRSGIAIPVENGETYTTTPCDVAIVEPPEGLFEGGFPIRKDIPHTWLSITLTEGKYHQVRKMVYTAGHPCLRLIRMSIEDMELGNLQPGAIREVDEADFFRLLKLDDSSLK